MIKPPGRQASTMEKKILAPIISQMGAEKVIVHHITEDSPYQMQLEVEFWHPAWGSRFKRIFIKH